MGPDKAWGAQYDLGARYRPSYPLENFLSGAPVLTTSQMQSQKFAMGGLCFFGGVWRRSPQLPKAGARRFCNFFATIT